MWLEAVFLLYLRVNIQIATNKPKPTDATNQLSRCTAPQTFMSNMLQAVSILYKTKLPLLLVRGADAT